MPKKKFKIMKEFSIGEISAVDEPAQAGATMSIMKARDMSQQPPVLPATVTKKEDTMSKTAEELQAELDTMANDLAKAQDLVKQAEKLAELTDGETDHMKSLDDKAKGLFLAKSSEDRIAEVNDAIEKSKEADPVIYKSRAGDVYRKSDDSRLVEMAKRDDVREAELKKMRDDATDAAFEKSGSSDFAKFKGTPSVKGALAKALAGIQDEATRTEVKEMLKAAHNAVGLTLKEVGAAVDDYEDDDTPTARTKVASAEKKLDDLAKAYASENKVDYSKAYTSVLETEEGQSLYAKTVA
jgi:hypothetical protein